MSKKTKIALTGGGTGGHVFPLLSTFNYLKEENKYDFVWVGEEDSLEQKVAKKNKIQFLSLPAGKIRRYFDPRNFYEPLKNLTGVFYGIYYILKHKIDIVFSKGGYVSLPLCISAFILRKPIYIHESDMAGGVSNKIIGKIATKVFYTFPNEKTIKINKKHIVVGQILNPELLDGLTDLNIPNNERMKVLVIAGSQGSTAIFEKLLKILPDLLDIDFEIILGEKNMHFRKDFKEFPNTKVHDFVTQKRLGKIMKETDIAITRAGATTLFELYNFGIHSLIVPLKGSASDHQLKNAEYFRDQFSSDLLDQEKDLDLELFRLLQKYKQFGKQGLNIDDFFKPLKIIQEEINF